MWDIGLALLGCLAGGAVAALGAVALRRASLRRADERALRAETALDIAERELGRLRGELASLTGHASEVREAAAAQAAQLDEARAQLLRDREAAEQQAAQLRDTFQALAGDALKGATEQFQKMAEGGLKNLVEKSDGNAELRQKAVAELVAPLKEALGKLSEEQQRISESRAREAAMFSTEMQSFRLRSEQLSTETQRLTTALRAPQVRGRWGEIQLRRTVELAGMSEHCDFVEQATVRSDEGVLRPDLLIHLPRGREVVVDSKVPFTHYLEAIEAPTDEARSEALRRHAQLVRAHVGKLTEKRYWDQFDGADFVVMFLPNEGLLAAAVEHDRELFERAAESRVLLATPTSLIALLRVIAVGWREERLARNAEEIAELGRELYDRLGRLSEHFSEVGKWLGRTVRAYNESVGSYQTRVLSQARRFKELDAASERELEEPAILEDMPRELN
jgi:DNA recombination protein RmuC